MADKAADLAGPCIGNYKDIEEIMSNDYESLLNPKETQEAQAAAKWNRMGLKQFGTGVGER